jgi:hypothetical protein
MRPHTLILGLRGSAIALAPSLCAALLALALSGCVTPPTPPPPSPPPAEPPVVAPPAPVGVARPSCPSCDEQNREVARLRQELANRDAELRELRSSQRDQVKVLQESTREATRAKVKLRRLATQADAASYIAEVEVALDSARAAAGEDAKSPLLGIAQGMMESTAAAFALGDYGAAMERAAQAEQLVTAAADERERSAAPPRGAGELPFQAAVTLRAIDDSKMRRQPRSKAPVVVVVRKDTELVAVAYKGSWLRVVTPDGRSGWIAQRQVAAP